MWISLLVFSPLIDGWVAELIGGFGESNRTDFVEKVSPLCRRSNSTIIGLAADVHATTFCFMNGCTCTKI